MSEYLDGAVDAARLGEEWAWRALYEWVTPKLKPYVAARGAPDPDEAVGEVWLQVSRNLGSFEGSAAQFRSWVFMIAHSRVVDQVRRQRVREGVHKGERATYAPSAEDQVLGRTDVADIASVLEALPSIQRTVILLRVVAELSVSETAQVLGVSPSAVKTAQHRGIARLRRVLEKSATDPLSHAVTG